MIEPLAPGKWQIPFWLAAMGIALICFLLLFASHRAYADGPKGSGNADWFRSLHSKDKTWCCNGYDGIGVDVLGWKVEAGKYYVAIGKDWIEIPDGAVVEEPNRVGRPIIWLNYDKTVRCFLPGSLG